MFAPSYPLSLMSYNCRIQWLRVEGPLCLRILVTAQARELGTYSVGMPSLRILTIRVAEWYLILLSLSENVDSLSNRAPDQGCVSQQDI